MLNFGDIEPHRRHWGARAELERALRLVREAVLQMRLLATRR